MVDGRAVLLPWDEQHTLGGVWRRAGDSLRAVIDAVDRNPGVRWVHLDTVGVDRLPLTKWANRGIRVSNGRGLTTTQVAEWTIAALLLAARRLDLSIELSRQHVWLPPQEELRTLHGSHLVVVGLGPIGLRVSQMAVALGAVVTGVVRSPIAPSDPRLRTVPHILPVSSLHEALEGAELVALCAPATRDSTRIIAAETIARLHQGAWIVNAARGDLIEESALLDALESGQLGGAVLDVVVGEKPAADSRLWSRPNVVLTGHSADFPRPPADVAAHLFSEELQRFLGGERLANEVDLEHGY